MGMTYEKPVVMFGSAELAITALSVFAHNGPKVVAVTLDEGHMQGDEFRGLPVVPFQEVVTAYPPADFDMFVAVGYKQMNHLRAAKCGEARRAGYKLISYIHPGVHLWPCFTHGDNCLILENNSIQPGVRLGNAVIAYPGNVIAHDTSIGDNVFISTGAKINGYCRVGDNCFIGSGATVVDHVTIGGNCIVGAGALVKEDTHDGCCCIAPRADVVPMHLERLKSLI